MSSIPEEPCRKAARAFGFDFVGGNFVLQGKGEAENSYTSTNDIARLVAHVLTSLPSDELEWRIFRIEGERTVSTFACSHYVCCLILAYPESPGIKLSLNGKTVPAEKSILHTTLLKSHK